jgi:hypothetical protein
MSKLGLKKPVRHQNKQNERDQVCRRAETEIRHTLDPSLLSLLVVPLVRELRSTRSCDFLKHVWLLALRQYTN